MKRKNLKDFFWPSYVDVMTNLFAITLVLFVVSFFLFKKRTDELNASQKEYMRIQEMNEAIKQLDNNSFFKYNEEFKKHILTLTFEYKIDQFAIPEGLTNPDIEVISDIRNVGKSIIQTIKDINEEYIVADNSREAIDVKFLVVIEGQASIDAKSKEEYNDILSYRRALHLKRFWLDSSNDVRVDGVSFNTPELKCELIVSESGFSGSPREDNYIFVKGVKKINTANQRFLVHIVPVIDWSK